MQTRTAGRSPEGSEMSMDESEIQFPDANMVTDA